MSGESIIILLVAGLVFGYFWVNRRKGLETKKGGGINRPDGNDTPDNLK